MSRFFATLLMITLGTNACLASEGQIKESAFGRSLPHT